MNSGSRSADLSSGSKAQEVFTFTGCAADDLLMFKSYEAPQLFTHLEEVRRSLVRLCRQRNRLRKEVHRLSSQVMRNKSSEDNKTHVHVHEAKPFVWKKKQPTESKKSTDSTCILNRRNRNHRGHRKAKQDINSIVQRSIQSFRQIAPKLESLPSILSKLPSLLDRTFNEIYFLINYNIESRRRHLASLQSKVFKGSIAS
jgi:chromosome segregation ATPase